MKRKSYKIFLFLLAALLAALMLVGCEKRAQFADELIPDALGKTEGLWLYKGATRSRTDGTESELLFDSVEISGTEYSFTEFSVRKYIYSRAAHNVIYLLDIDEYGYCLYLFDYRNKTGKYLCDAPDDSVTFTTSDGFTYAHFDKAGYLFDGEGNLLCDRIDGTLKNGILYNVSYHRTADEETYSLEWYLGGYHNAILSDSPNVSYSVDIYNDYIYLLAGNKPMYAVEKNTEKVTKFTIFDITPDTDKYVDQYRNIEERFYYDGSMYVFSVVYCIIDRGDETREGKDEWYWYLHKIDGDIATLECEFGEVRRGMHMGVYDGKFYFQARTLGNLYQRHYRYDPKTGKLKRILKLRYHRGTIPSDPTAAETQSDNRVKINGYEFSVSSRMYGYSGFLNGPEGYCYYLNRKHEDTTEIMQYSFENGYFYDDIREF